MRAATPSLVGGDCGMKVTRVALAAMSVMLLCNLPRAAHSDVRVTSTDGRGHYARIEITGVISKSDVSHFAMVVGIMRPLAEILDVELNSPGGDVLAAMAIGELVRKEWMWDFDFRSAGGRVHECLCSNFCRWSRKDWRRLSKGWNTQASF